MGIPEGQKIVDLMMQIPDGTDRKDWYEFMKPLLMDKESQEVFKFPVQYMFKNIPSLSKTDDYVAAVVEEMDKYNVERAMVTVRFEDSDARRALREYPSRFIGAYQVNPNRGMEGVRDLRRAAKELGIVAASSFPCGLCPQVPINDKKYYPLYAACIDLDIPIFVTCGVPGPRLPMGPQKVELIDEVCWFFPELKFVMRHGGEPWEALAVKLMLKYPNLYYSTSAFAPKYYPKAIMEFANTRGAKKVLYAGYFPMGLSLERIVRELNALPLRDHVWPLFLRENAMRILKLEP